MLRALLLLLCSGFALSVEKSENFDFLILTQTWPKADCDIWKAEDSSHYCTWPSEISWIVHGLWPTRNHSIGPNNCEGPKFNPDKLKEILPRLENEWANMHGNTGKYDFWRHEWEKHGTCAIHDPLIVDELSYFETALTLMERYPPANFFYSKEIFTGAEYDYKQYFDAIKAFTHKNPIIQCEFDKIIGSLVISQVGICFDKQLQVIDCDEAHGGLNHGCHAKAAYLYIPSNSMAGFYYGVGMTTFVVLLTCGCFTARYFYLRRQRQADYQNI